jgi:hypothetical protein
MRHRQLSSPAFLGAQLYYTCSTIIEKSDDDVLRLLAPRSRA